MMPALVDPFVSIALLAACATYLHVSVGVVYATRAARRLLEVVVLSVGVAALVLSYRFALFALTLYTA
jgi:hypothetical protein